ncbi:hypothetical protein C8J57DRAFT_1610849 [Mycena rebaudengoi]|nr:hypothetical protein C8J57DRAFT_1610849 [Mycena rebaudengoi]
MSSSRRESRVSMNVRQNDALLEFENFKKKFLLANKHITKLNSTLCMKIEELNTQITTLYTENLRLRASEIALAAQLKRERDKSRKILSDAEAATNALSSHFAVLRQTFNIPAHSPPSPSPTPPRVRPASGASNVNAPPRLSRAPVVPDINEDDEPLDVDDPNTPPRKPKKKERRLSASRLPLPARGITPPPLAVPPPPPPTAASAPLHIDLSALPLPKKRRQSGLLLDVAVVDIDELVLNVDDLRENDRDRENEKERERKRRAREDTIPTKPKAKLKDVTNSNSPRAGAKAAPPPLSISLPPPPSVEARTFLVAAPPSPPPPEPRPPPTALVPAPPLAPPPAPAPVSSSGSSSSVDSAADGAARDAATADAEASGRESRRTRKSVNYAEPKLNTKMRKPEPPAGGAPPAPARRQRASAAAAIPQRGPIVRRPSPPVGHVEPDPEDDVDEGDLDVDEAGAEEDSDRDAWADGEYVPEWAHVNVDGRRRTGVHTTKRKASVAQQSQSWDGEARRHSMAV